jgi:protein-tyrosine phosphatase
MCHAVTEGIRFIHERIQAGGKVYIHRASGFHRAPTMTAAYLMSTGLSMEDALATIRSARPFAKPIKSQIDVLKRLSSEV